MMYLDDLKRLIAEDLPAADSADGSMRSDLLVRVFSQPFQKQSY